MKNRATKVQHKNTKNQTVILIFPISCTYLLICCIIYLKVWLHGAKCTDNRQVPWNGLWFRTVRTVRQNNKNQTVILIFPIHCTYLLICCVISLNIWWHCAQFTDNRHAPWNDPWFRTAQMERQNIIREK